MRYFLTATSERGKPITKSGNEHITIQLTEDREQRFMIQFTGDQLDILNYATGKTHKIEYFPCTCGMCEDVPR